MNTYLLGPDMGDVLASLVICRHLGRGHIRLHDTPNTKGFGPERYNYIRPLIAMQPYCESIAMFDEKEELDFTADFRSFRDHWKRGRLLSDKLAVCAGLNPSDVDTDTPWITVPSSPRHGKIILVRSERHQGFLHWYRIVMAKPNDCLFLGLRQECDVFNWNCTPGNPGRTKPFVVPLAETRDAVEAAQLIAGSRLFVSNCTFFLWLAEAMKHPNMLVECAADDSEFRRPGVRNVRRPEDNPTLKEFQCL